MSRYQKKEHHFCTETTFKHLTFIDTTLQITITIDIMIPALCFPA